MEDAKGLDMAKKLLHHSPDSNTYHKNCGGGLQGVDIFAIAAGETENIKIAPVAIRRIEPRSIDRVDILAILIKEDEIVIC
jgi:hypothetical protein